MKKNTATKRNSSFLVTGKHESRARVEDATHVCGRYLYERNSSHSEKKASRVKKLADEAEKGKTPVEADKADCRCAWRVA